MKPTPGLFDEPPPTVLPTITDDVCANKHGGNPQSEMANDALQSVKSEMCSKVYNFLISREHEGATTEEVSIALGMRYTTASGRMADLKRLGLARATGRERATTGGAMAGVVVATEFATLAGESRERAKQPAEKPSALRERR